MFLTGVFKNLNISYQYTHGQEILFHLPHMYRGYTTYIYIYAYFDFITHISYKIGKYTVHSIQCTACSVRSVQSTVFSFFFQKCRNFRIFQIFFFSISFISGINIFYLIQQGSFISTYKINLLEI